MEDRKDEKGTGKRMEKEREKTEEEKGSPRGKGDEGRGEP